SVQVTSTVALASVTVTVTPPSGNAATTSLSRVGTPSTYSGSVTIPANQGATAATYRIAFAATDAKNTTSSLDGGTVTVAVPDLTPPTITNPTDSPSTLSWIAGTVSIGALVTHNVLVS